MATVTRRTYLVTLPDGSTVRRRYKRYAIRYLNAAGRRVWCKGYTDKGATQQLAAKLEAAVARGEQALVNPYSVHNARPIGEHVADWLADLAASGRDDKYRHVVAHRLDIVIAGAGWASLRDLDAATFMAWRARAKAEPRPGTRKAAKGPTTVSARTLNHYLDTVRAFANWCAAGKRMAGVPLGGGRVIATAVAGIGRVEGPTVRRRRALTDEQAAALLAVAPAGRALVYRVGMAVGLRRGELEDLQWGDVRLNATRPYVVLRTEASKSKRADRVGLPQTLAADLRTHKPKASGEGDPVFPDVPSIELWRVDLAAAGIPYFDGQGRQADFHGGTRKTLCTRLHRANVPLATAMRTMRHTDARLTMVDYVDDEQMGGETASADLPEPIAPAAINPGPPSRGVQGA